MEGAYPTGGVSATLSSDDVGIFSTRRWHVIIASISHNFIIFFFGGGRTSVVGVAGYIVFIVVAFVVVVVVFGGGGSETVEGVIFAHVVDFLARDSNNNDLWRKSDEFFSYIIFYIGGEGRLACGGSINETAAERHEVQ